MVDTPHEFDGLLMRLAEDALKHQDYEIHRRIIIIVQQHPIHGRVLDLLTLLCSDHFARSWDIFRHCDVFLCLTSVIVEETFHYSNICRFPRVVGGVRRCSLLKTARARVKLGWEL
jgi:hypothetical protein